MTMTAGAMLRGRFRIDGVLGAGHSSTTYLAFDTESAVPCVVKELSVARAIESRAEAQSYDPADFTKVVELFEREARILSHLVHPGVPRLIDHFADESGGDARLYTVQEHIEGQTLQALVEGGRHFSEDEARQILRRTAEILDHLHRLSPPLVHRDIKPSNILIGPGDSVHLIDFGAVKTAMAADDLDGKTIVGTFGYMPMEQYEARALPASDIYALGGTMVYLLSHRAPHELPRQGMRLDFRSQVNVSEGFAELIARMVAADWRERFQSGGELLRALDGLDRAVQQVEPVEGLEAPPKKGTRGTPVDGRRRLLAYAAALAVAITGAGTAAFFMAGEGPVADAPGEVSPRQPSSESGETGEPRPVAEVDGVLTVDIYRDFAYRSSGWPMGRSTGQTALRNLTDEPRESLILPREVEDPAISRYFGFFPMGNGEDAEVALLLTLEEGEWALWVDANNNENLTDDGPPLSNQGSGPLLAAATYVQVEIVGTGGEEIRRPYHLWAWFDLSEDGTRARGRFYSLNHYAGSVVVDGRSYDATAFEQFNHDALYRESGLCIDLDGNGECNEDHELFYDGDVVGFPEKSVRLVLRYP